MTKYLRVVGYSKHCILNSPPLLLQPQTSQTSHIRKTSQTNWASHRQTSHQDCLMMGFPKNLFKMLHSVSEHCADTQRWPTASSIPNVQLHKGQKYINWRPFHYGVNNRIPYQDWKIRHLAHIELITFCSEPTIAIKMNS